MLGFQNVTWFRAAMARTDCGTLNVPLDYARPRVRWITIAVTRLKAIDQAHRLGSIAVNPGGPGGSGYLMPFSLSEPHSAAARLNERYDLIGITFAIWCQGPYEQFAPYREFMGYQAHCPKDKAVSCGLIRSGR
jgi:hypothetical protein